MKKMEINKEKKKTEKKGETKRKKTESENGKQKWSVAPLGFRKFHIHEESLIWKAGSHQRQVHGGKFSTRT